MVYTMTMLYMAVVFWNLQDGLAVKRITVLKKHITDGFCYYKFTNMMYADTELLKRPKTGQTKPTKYMIKILFVVCCPTIKAMNKRWILCQLN